jgi:hypothetical protein
VKKLLLLFCLVYNSGYAFVVYEKTRIWDQKSIKFYFIDGTHHQKQLVRKHTKLWQKYTGIEFIFSNNKPPNFSFSNYFRITFKGAGNHSNIGAVNGLIQLANLAENEIENQRIILHEFGHMLGLSHEHQRFDRPHELNNKELIRDCKLKQNKSDSWCENNFGEIKREEVFVKSSYDSQSVMHYRISDITSDSGALDRIGDEDQLSVLSLTDKRYIAMLYNPELSDKDILRMHKQDLQDQKKFIKESKQNYEQKILQLKTASCKVLETGKQSIDGKYCNNGYMIIGSDGYSFPDENMGICYSDFETLRDKMNHYGNCGLTISQLASQRRNWNENSKEFGNCKRLETGVTNNQGYSCTEGYSYVTKENDMIGEKTMCLISSDAIYKEMQNNQVCNMNARDFRIYKKLQQEQLKQKMKTKSCEIVNSESKRFTCPEGFEYRITYRGNVDSMVNSSCYQSPYQAIHVMRNLSECN